MANIVKKDLFLLGAGGHAAVIADIAAAGGEWSVAGRISAEEQDSFLSTAPSGTAVILAVGENALRRRIADALPPGKFVFPNMIHPSAVVAGDVAMGHGNVVMAGAIVNPRGQIGNFTVMNTRATLDHDGALGDYASLAPSATVCGTVGIGEGAYIGAGAVVIHGLSIGAWSVIGAGAVVIAQTSVDTVYAGNPAKSVRVKQRDELILKSS